LTLDYRDGILANMQISLSHSFKDALPEFAGPERLINDFLAEIKRRR